MGVGRHRLGEGGEVEAADNNHRWRSSTFSVLLFLHKIPVMLTFFILIQMFVSDNNKYNVFVFRMFNISKHSNVQKFKAEISLFLDLLILLTYKKII